MSMGIIFILLVFTDFLKIVSSTLDIMLMIYEILQAIKNAVNEALFLILISLDKLKSICHDVYKTIKELQNFMKNDCLYYLFFLGVILVALGLKCGIKRKRPFGIEVRTIHQSNSHNDQREETTIKIEFGRNSENRQHQQKKGGKQEHTCIAPSTKDFRKKRENLKYNKSAVYKSVQQNIELIEKDIVISGSNLLDELQNYNYFSEHDLNNLKQLEREDQAHYFADKLEDMDDEGFLHVLELLSKCKFDHIGSALKSSHDDYKSARIRPSLPDTQHHICPICRLQCEVDIKDMRSKLKKEDLLPKQLYTDVNKCSDGRGHQDILWKRLFKHFISLEQERVETTFVDFLKPNHKGLYDYFIQKYPTHFECSCQK